MQRAETYLSTPYRGYAVRRGDVQNRFAAVCGAPQLTSQRYRCLACPFDFTLQLQTRRVGRTSSSVHSSAKPRSDGCR